MEGSRSDRGEVAICVGLDGWHYSRAALDGFEDPKEAHYRRVSAGLVFSVARQTDCAINDGTPTIRFIPRPASLPSVVHKRANVPSPKLIEQGAAFTFDLPSYSSFLTLLRETIAPSASPIPFPTFDHALKDPLPSPVSILPRHRIVIIEGLYTMLDRPGWRECADMMDLRVLVQCDEDVCRRRVVRRNWEAGIVKDLKECEARGEPSPVDEPSPRFGHTMAI